jgi:glycosyltransferase involved in cell wall biosynthesis
MAAMPLRRLCFHRDFRRYTGGHGKVWDYFGHARAHPRWEASAYLTPESIATHNPWGAVPGLLDDRWPPADADALFLGGMDWTAWPADDPRLPVINLVQHVRHADPDHPLFQHLSRRAVRICVSAAVAAALDATGRVNGPVRVIEPGLDLPALPAVTAAPRRGIFIGALKQKAPGRALAKQLREQGRDVVLADHWQPRADYLAALAAAGVAVLLPNPTEGFYLPALEAMALGCAVVVPDCVGNRAYLAHEGNALVPDREVEALLQAVVRLDDPALRRRLVEAGAATAARFDMGRERAAFHTILDDLDALWRQ